MSHRTPGTARPLDCARRTCRVVALLACCFAVPGPAARAAGCEYDLGDVASAPRFQDYPARPLHRAKPAAPVLATRDARLFRTVIQQAAASGPNFAGSFTVAVWGCGAACTDFAIVDARSGRVVFDDALRDIAGIHVSAKTPDGVEPAYYSLRFRPDSRLLVLLGAPGEQEARDGIGFYEWTGAKLNLLRFVSRSDLCKAAAPHTAP